MHQVQALRAGSGNPCKGQQSRSQGRKCQVDWGISQRDCSSKGPLCGMQCENNVKHVAACFTGVSVMLRCMGHRETGCKLTGCRIGNLVMSTVHWEEHSMPRRTMLQDAEENTKRNQL